MLAGARNEKLVLPKRQKKVNMSTRRKPGIKGGKLERMRKWLRWEEEDEKGLLCLQTRARTSAVYPSPRTSLETRLVAQKNEATDC